jgi:hypothetical protein
MKMYGDVEVYATILDLEGEWSASHPDRFNPRESAALLVSFRAGLDTVEREKSVSLAEK